MVQDLQQTMRGRHIGGILYLYQHHKTLGWKKITFVENLLASNYLTSSHYLARIVLVCNWSILLGSPGCLIPSEESILQELCYKTSQAVL